MSYWSWIALAVVAMMTLGYYVGQKIWSVEYEATAQIIRNQDSAVQLFQSRQIAGSTLAGMLNAREVQELAGSHAVPRMTAREISKMVIIRPESNSDIIRVSVTHPDIDEAVALSNAYAEEAVAFTRRVQARDAEQSALNLEQQLDEVRSEILVMKETLYALPATGIRRVMEQPRQSALPGRLEEARIRLAELLGRYTDNHPLVEEQTARIAVLENQVAAMEAEIVEPEKLDNGARQEVIQVILTNLEEQRAALDSRQRQARAILNSPPGYVRQFSPAMKEAVSKKYPVVQIGLLMAGGALFGLSASLFILLILVLFDRRLRTVDDITRVTQLPVLASLGDFSKMSDQARDQWAFRTWISLKNKLNGSANGNVFGITSAGAGEGRSLWVNNLAEAANRCGYRVLTITTRPSPENGTAEQGKWTLCAGGFWELNRSQSDESHNKLTSKKSESGALQTVNEEASLSVNVLTEPEEVSRRLDMESEPALMHIPLPGWVWNLQRRKEWASALEHWSNLDNIVILVELPPATSAETVLLSQALPNLIWLVDSQRADAVNSVYQLDTLRQAKCNLIGAVVNHAAKPFSDRFVRWLPRTQMTALFILASSIYLLSGVQTEAQTSGDLYDNTNRDPMLSANTSGMRAEWQERLTLGPGDVLRLALYAEPDATREEVVIQPDGLISFLEVQEFKAAGLTVDEVRTQLDEALSQYRRAPRTMVAPLEFRSKKYYMLGKVANVGAFPLNRPLTIVEAVAQAEGFSTGLSDLNVVEQVDLSRSFLIRDGKQANVDFEQLFGSGDLTHNIAIEPGDYLYFPAAEMEEIHLLGEVEEPGAVTFKQGLTATRAIASSGGFTPGAWRKRILVVRGSLENPETFVVNVAGVVSGSEPDIELLPSDLVYVHERPWIRAEELLDNVSTAFVQSVIIYWISDDVVPLVR